MTTIHFYFQIKISAKQSPVKGSGQVWLLVVFGICLALGTWWREYCYLWCDEVVLILIQNTGQLSPFTLAISPCFKPRFLGVHTIVGWDEVTWTVEVDPTLLCAWTTYCKRRWLTWVYMHFAILYRKLTTSQIAHGCRTLEYVVGPTAQWYKVGSPVTEGYHRWANVANDGQTWNPATCESMFGHRTNGIELTTDSNVGATCKTRSKTCIL